jgi:transposase-like protein
MGVGTHIFIPRRPDELAIPKSIQELSTLYGTQEDCLAWGTGLMECPHCSGVLYWREKRMLWRCRTCERDSQFSALTAWDASRAPLPKWFEVAWWLAEGTVSIRRLQKLTGVSRRGLHHIVTVYRREAAHWGEQQLLEGEVEVDETFLGWNGKKGRASQPAVMLVAERNGLNSQHRIVAVQMGSYTKAATCERLVLRHVKQGSFVYTDDWAGYRALNWLEYHHEAVNISKAPAPAHAYLPAVHSAANNLKNSLRVYSRHPTVTYFPLYLAEWSWRYSNRKKTTGERFAELVTMINERRER